MEATLAQGFGGLRPVAPKATATGGMYVGGGMPSCMLPLPRSRQFLSEVDFEGDRLLAFPSHVVLRPRQARPFREGSRTGGLEDEEGRSG